MKSPCIGECRLVNGICSGCNRSTEQIRSFGRLYTQMIVLKRRIMKDKDDLQFTEEQGNAILRKLAESIHPDGGDDSQSWEVWEDEGTKFFASCHDDRISLILDYDTGKINISKLGGNSFDFELPTNEDSVQIIDALYSMVLEKKRKSLQSILKIFGLDTNGKG